MYGQGEASGYSNGALRSTSGFVQTTSNAIAPLDELAKSLDSSRERIVTAAIRVRQVAEGLFGVTPEMALQANTNAPPRAGTVGSLNDQADSLSRAVAELEQQIARLQPLVPNT